MNHNIVNIPTISRTEFTRRLGKKRFEDSTVTQTIEAYFRAKRGYVFRLPPPGTPVIMMVSGGIESTILWGIMLEKYKLAVYPFFLRRGRTRWKKEKAAVDYFARLYKRRYPSLFHAPFYSPASITPMELNTTNPYAYYHPNQILNNYHIGTGLSTIFTQSGFPIAYPLFALSYARYLLDHEDVHIDYFFNGVAPGDGDFVASQTFTALRTTMFTMCIATTNPKLVFGSLAWEKDIGHWLDKNDLIAMGSKLGLPLEHTWSCYNYGRYQCGDHCLTCYYRRVAFRDAKVQDKTIYLCNTRLVRIRRRFMRLIRRLTIHKGDNIVNEIDRWKPEEVKI